MSQKRARLRALASLGLSIGLFTAVVPAVSAASPSVSSATISSATISSAVALPASRTPLARRIPASDLALAPADIFIPGAPSTTSSTRRAALVPVRAAAPATIEAALRVIALARTHLGARYAYGATGPRAFDCSGLVYRVFADAGLVRRIDGLRSAAGLYAHFRALHMTSTRNPQLGDLVIFGGGSHVGIYVGSGRVIHAILSGVAITRIAAVYPGFTTYIHLGLTTLQLPLR